MSDSSFPKIQMPNCNSKFGLVGANLPDNIKQDQT